jgi:hypothetical protein
MARLNLSLAFAVLFLLVATTAAAPSTSSQELSAVVTPTIGWQDNSAYGSHLKTSAAVIDTPQGSFKVVVAYSER